MITKACLVNNFFMNWTTIYISGKPGFEREVQRKLDRADIAVMNGSAGTGNCLYWISDSATLRTFKETIGADLIWKYRLRFSAAIEHIDHDLQTGFTEREKKMILDMETRSRQPIL